MRSRNEEIIGADHLASFLQVSRDLRVVGSSVVGKTLGPRRVWKKRVEGSRVLHSARHFKAVEQFRLWLPLGAAGPRPGTLSNTAALMPSGVAAAQQQLSRAITSMTCPGQVRKHPVPETGERWLNGVLLGRF